MAKLETIWVKRGNGGPMDPVDAAQLNPASALSGTRIAAAGGK